MSRPANLTDIELILKRAFAEIDRRANNERWEAYKRALRQAYDLGAKTHDR